MVFIAIDKHSRKILGYLCKNAETVAYCCSDCDFEFASSSNLEEHMLKHEKPLNNDNQIAAEHVEEAIGQKNDQNLAIDQSNHQEAIVPPNEQQPNDEHYHEEAEAQEQRIGDENIALNDAINDIPLVILSDVEKEKQLQIKYQVTPCCIKLTRYEQKEKANTDAKAAAAAAAAEGIIHTVPMECNDIANPEIVVPKRRGRKRKIPLPEMESAAEKTVPTEMAPEKMARDLIISEQLTKRGTTAETTATQQIASEEIRITEQTAPEKMVSDEAATQKSSPAALDNKEEAISDEKTATEAIPNEIVPMEMTSEASPARRKSRLGAKKSLESPKKMNQQKPEKSVRKKPPPEVCCLCGQKFQSSFVLAQHMKSHLQTSTDSPVFPCSVCGKNVSNLKLHLRQHNAEKPVYKEAKAKKTARQSKGGATSAVKNTLTASEMPDVAVDAIDKSQQPADVAKTIEVTTADVPNLVNIEKPVDISKPVDTAQPIDVATPNTTTMVEEASSSTDAVFTADTTEKEPENGITSNEAITESIDPDPYHINGEQPFLSPSFQHSSDYGLPEPTNEPPLNLLEEFPIIFDDAMNVIHTEVVGENEPSQSTQQTIDTPDQFTLSLLVEPNTDAIEQNGFGCNNGNGDGEGDGEGDGDDATVDESANGFGGDESVEDTNNDGEGEGDDSVAENTKTLDFGCTKCKRRFATEERCERHIALHSKKIDCELCGKRIALSYKYFHMKRYHSKAAPSDQPQDT